MTPDPIGLEGGINLYRYANADPINWFDPDGLHGIIFFGRGPVYINRPNWLRGGRFPRSGELNKPLPQPPKPKANDPCPLEQNNPPMELPKSWWGRLMDKIGSLPGSGGVSAPPLLILEEDPWTT